MNNNVFEVYLIDTTRDNDFIIFNVFTDNIKPEVFFKKDSFYIQKIQIDKAGICEDFDSINTYFYWDSVTWNNQKFSGKAKLIIPEELIGNFNPDIFYPMQKITFEF